MKQLITIPFILLIVQWGIAQPCNLTISGHIEDTDTKEKLHAANISLLENGQIIVTDDQGDFEFKGLCAGKYTLLITHIGCDSVKKKISLTKNYHADILLPHTRKELGDVVIESQKLIPNSGLKKEISGQILEQTKGLSLAEALSKLNGVTLLQTGSTISKPVIHGLHSNRILTINNGIRQEGQQWGNEHAPEIDPFIAYKLVVVKGVDGLRYGSDAIGGVILVEPKPLRNKHGIGGEINTSYFTNNMQYVVSGVFEQELKKQPAFRYRIQGTYKRGANIATPNYRLNNTGSEENNFSITLGWKKERFNTELFYSHFATKLGIFTGSHIGNLTDLLSAIAAPRPNEIFLDQNTYTLQRPYQDVSHDLLKSKTQFHIGENKFTLLFAGQYNQRKEFDIVRSSANTNPQLDLSIYTISEDLTWEHPKKSSFSGIGGLSLMQQDNSYSGRYIIPNYFAYTLGAYYIEKWSKHKWELQAGVRFDQKSIQTSRLKFNNNSINNDFNFLTWASSLNAIYKPSHNWKINTNISLASRSPHVNELLSDGIHHGTATYEKGDIQMNPERAINISGGLNYQHPSNTFSMDLFIYSNQIQDFIYQQPKPESPVLTIAGAFPLIQYQQTDATLNGFDLSTTWQIERGIEWNFKYSFLAAKNNQLNDWLIQMPANRLSNEFTFRFKDGKKNKDSYISAELMHVMQQKNTPSDANGKQDYKEAPNGYHLINLNASTTMHINKFPLTFSVGVRNLLNTVYRDYLNSMRYFTDEMGRNISIRMKIQF